MYKIGLTGGIGTGKTYVSRQFAEMGIPVFYADDEAKKLYSDPAFCRQVGRDLGIEAMADGGNADMALLARLAFGDKRKLAALNRLVHPLVMRQFEEWCAGMTTAAVMMESALIFESGMERHFDKVIVIDAPDELRISRILARNPQWTRDEVLRRMAHQMPQEEKCRRADLIIWTGDTYREAGGPPHTDNTCGSIEP